jgi:hypothetical protein
MSERKCQNCGETYFAKSTLTDCYHCKDKPAPQKDEHSIKEANIQYCFKCRKDTLSNYCGDCIYCGLSKQTPEALTRAPQKDYDPRMMADELLERAYDLIDHAQSKAMSDLDADDWIKDYEAHLKLTKDFI